MEKMSQKQKNWFVALSIIIVLVLSSILGAILLDEERTTGGMDIKWKMDIKNADDTFGLLNNTIIVNDLSSKQLESIDSNGNVIHRYPYTQLVTSGASDNNYFCYIDAANGTDTIVCIGANGLQQWNFSYPNINEIIHMGGNYYLLIHDNSSMDTIVCISGGGSERWAFTNTTSISVIGVCSDGTTIVGQGIFDPASASNPVKREWITISPSGAVLGELNITPASEIYRYVGEASNGTIIAYSSDFMNGSMHYVGLTKDLKRNWSLGLSYGEGGITIGSVNYQWDGWDGQTENGTDYSYSILSAYNISNGVLLFRTNLTGVTIGTVYVNGGTTFTESDSSNLWTVQTDGRAYEANGTTGWQIVGAYGNGLLINDDIGIKLIDPHGSTEWQYNLDSWTISSVNIGGDGTIFVVSNDGVMAIHKPTMSMTMTYLMMLVGFDILVSLTGSIWLFDHRSKEKRNGL
jgi:hypothetical protein